MKYYFAPLEGVTNALFRRTYDRVIGGIDSYYSPFVTTRDGGIMKRKEKSDIEPANNPGFKLIPQLLTTDASAFVQSSLHMEEMGYDEVNLNLGCPSGTVVPKGKGAGFLRTPDKLDRFLEEIFDRCRIQISLKTRIGFESADEFPRLLEIYNQYPVKELTIHLRTREEFYRGSVHEEVFQYAYTHSKAPLCYNGDVKTVADVRRLEETYPDLEAVMIGRGFLIDPGFIGNSGQTSDEKRANIFLDEMCKEYCQVISGDTHVLHKMKELWNYRKDAYENGDKIFKKIRKARSLSEYKDICYQIKSKKGEI
ncbi:MAG: tRNA-dihydrouridine synthase family protein [Eubacterium sp.]|nr:tRNA-dihydrouridine synthase family protein [Eubacterium sp.]